ncbi:MAG: hypothetical protein RQ761_03570 [Bacteroidales bacterium]|nr:hypothetical protein [Bacteroidales bacterium]
MFVSKHIAARCILFMVLAFAMISHEAEAQYYSTGQEPFSVRWRQIKTESVRLIYPDYYEQQARWLASYIDTVSVYASRTLSYKPKRVSLIMHTQSAISNAVVAWAPKRMEFYTTPPQDMYAQPWLEQLGLHEYRHVVQIEKLKQGPTKVISWLFGEQGTAAILGLYVPPWFLEGDAVATETALSQSGRGRVPQFEMRLRAQVLEKDLYAYDKAVLGSYRDFIPDQYVLGYHLIAEGRRLYGDSLWEHVLNRVARRPYMITPFQKGIKDISGKRKIPFYRECMQNLSIRWQMQEKTSRVNLTGFVEDSRKHYTNYRFPTFRDDGSILAMRNGIDDIARIVSISDDGTEKIVFTPGLIKDETLSYASGILCWAESRPHPRWANKSYTVIQLLDVESRKVRTIHHRKRYLAPSLSKDATKIVAVDADNFDQYSLVVLDTKSGGLLRKIPAPDNHYPLTPVWLDEDALLVIFVSERGKSLQRVDIQSGEAEILIPWTFAEISQPLYHQPYVYFVGSWTGISNIYRLRIRDSGANGESDDIHMITESRFGATDPYISADGKTLLYSDYRAMGFRILEYTDPQAVPTHPLMDQSIGLQRVLQEQEKIVPPGSSIAPSQNPSRKYSKIGNLFNFHSWAPLDINAGNYTINPGVSVMSQNLLSSSFLSAGYNYNVNEQLGKMYATYTYAGWYPMIDISADYGLRRDYAYLPDYTTVKWNEANLRGGLRLPLNLSRGKYFSGTQAYVYANQVIRRIVSPDTIRFRKPDIFSSWYGLRYYRQIKSTSRDIIPRWGQSIGLYYRHTPFETTKNSAIAAVTLNLYFPGIIRHQGLHIYAGYQQRQTGYYKFSDLVAYPRGVSGRQHRELYSLRTTYAFPIACPDWSIGPIIYLKRLRGNLFYDYAIGRNVHSDSYYSSLGAELFAETHLLRFYAPIEFGVRTTYQPWQQRLDWQFLVSVGFDSFYVGQRAIGRVSVIQ